MQRLCSFVPIGVALSLLFASGRLPADDSAPSPAAVWQQLKDGNARFAADKATGPRRDLKRRAEQARGQRPIAIVLSCSDSRVVPELLFDQGLGDLFVARVAGNVSSTSMIGSIEFAVGNLKVPLIVVLGHDNCGAVSAALAGKAIPGDLGKLVKQIHPGAPASKDQAAALASGVEANARFQARWLTEHSPLLRDSVSTGRVRIVAGVYGLQTGKVQWLETAASK